MVLFFGFSQMVCNGGDGPDVYDAHKVSFRGVGQGR